MDTTQLDIDIDLRIGIDVWRQVEDAFASENRVLLSSLLRFAYGLGYCDALVEPERGMLCRENGFAVPARRSTDQNYER